MQAQIERTLVLMLVLVLVGVLPCRAQETADILERARPSVVTILTTDKKGKKSGLGSGFIVREDGIIVTAWHVVANAAKIRVVMPNGITAPVSQILSADKAKDFACLKIKREGLSSLPLGNSDAVRQGDKILTLGSPLGLEQTASEGIVSAIRKLPTFGTLLQITAPISAGNSGGPVLNGRGEVVGIAIFKLKEGQSLNFAVAINHIKAKLPAMEHVIGRLGILKQKASVYRERNKQSELLTEVRAGAYVAVQKDAGDWLGVLMADKTIGWLLRQNVRILNYEVVNTNDKQTLPSTEVDDKQKPLIIVANGDLMLELPPSKEAMEKRAAEEAKSRP